MTSIYNGLKALLGFFTIFPTGMESLETVSQYYFLCPLIGLLIGISAGFVGLFSQRFWPHVVVGFLVLSSILILSGFHHFDGLLDFSDAVMVRGSSLRKTEVMHDMYTGAAAVAVGLIVFSVTGFSLGLLSDIQIIRVATLSEVVAKESMVLMAYRGNSPQHEGMGKHMVESMKNGHLRFIFSMALSGLISFLLVGISFVYVFIVMALITEILTIYANKVLGGVSGDVLGATNEINRLISLLTWLACLSIN